MLLTRGALLKELRAYASASRAKTFLSFFKTGPGQYGEGDRFLGVTVPEMRLLAKKFRDLALVDLDLLLSSPWHEERFVALLILALQFEKATTEKERKMFVDFYLAHTARINNWDLVDVSAYRILGEWLVDHPRTLLKRLACSPLVWERRIAMVATFAFIRRKEHADTLLIAELLLEDRHDLIHKAVGWMLREVGKRCGVAPLHAFLQAHLARLPRVTLRYAIERFSKAEQQSYLRG